MAILNIVKEGDPILRKKSREVEEITPRIKTLINDMLNTMRDARGCGLAGVQVGVLRRVIVVEVEPGEPRFLINPVIASRKGSETRLEGCLSVPERWGKVERPTEISVKYTDIDGNERTTVECGFAARVICHEVDHLDGRLYLDIAKQMYTSEDLEKERNLPEYE